MIDSAPAPLTPADSDLRAFRFTPLFRARLFGSSFHARASDAEWRAGITLMLKSWDQTPAGSLPTDDIDLCRLAELGRDLKAWKKVRGGALHGWIACSDGRFYHPVVAETVHDALDGKRKQQEKTLAARIGAMRKRLVGAKSEAARQSMTAEIESLSQILSQLQSQKKKRSVTDSVTPDVTASNREGQEIERKGEGFTHGAHSPTDGSGSVTERDDKPPAELTEAEHHACFELVMARYPRFSGAVNLIVVENTCRQLIADGYETWASLEAHAERFANFVKHGGRSNPRYVDNPQKFFSSEALRRAAWDPPPSKAQAQQDANTDASLAWLNEQGAENAAR